MYAKAIEMASDYILKMKCQLQGKTQNAVER